MNNTQCEKPENMTEEEIAIYNGINTLVEVAHRNSRMGGWYTDPETGEPIARNVPEMICLIHSEVSEMMEGYRKDLPDDKLPGFPMESVEGGDIAIRLGDYCGYREINLGAVIVQKMRFNAVREDHKLENRKKSGGKKF